MNLKISPAQIPLESDSEGTFRVSGTRVTLDSVIYAFLQGETPEEITQHYPTVALADIYFVLGFYLIHREEVEEYLNLRRLEAEQLQRECEQRFDPSGFRERLMARRRVG